MRTSKLLSALLVPFVSFVTTIGSPKPTLALDFTYKSTIGGSYGSGNGEFSIPFYVATDKNSNVYITDSGNSRVEVFNSNGAFSSAFSVATQANSLRGIALDDVTGNIYVGDYAKGTLYKFSNSGTLLLSMPTLTPNISPSGVALDSLGNIYTSDAQTATVRKYDTTSGNYLSSFGNGFGVNSGSPGLFSPEGVTIDNAGNIYVVDSSSSHPQVQKFNSSGTFLSSFGSGLQNASGIAVDSNGNIFVANSGKNSIDQFDKNGNFVTSFGGAGNGSYQFNGPIGLALDSSNNLYVVDTGNTRVQIYEVTATAVPFEFSPEQGFILGVPLFTGLRLVKKRKINKT